MAKWQADFTIGFGDTDATGLVYHPNYLYFFEKARVCALLEIATIEGRSLEALIADSVFVVHQVAIQYKKSLRLGAKCRVQSSLVGCSPVRLFWQQDMLCCESNQTVCTAKIEVVTLGQNGRPQRHPKWLVNCIKEGESV